MSGAERLFDAITDVRGDYVDAAGDYRFERRRRLWPAAWRRYAALAACLAVIVGGAFALSQTRMGSSGGWSGDTDSGGWNGASPPGDYGIGDAAPPSGAEDDPPSGEGSGEGFGGGFACWDGSAGAVPVPAMELEGVAAAREITLSFQEDGGVMVQDRYILTAGEDGGLASVRYDGPGRPSQAGNADGGWRISLAAGDAYEICISTLTDVSEGVLFLSEAAGVPPEDTAVIVAGRQWMEEQGVAIVLGDTALDP